MRKQLCAYCDGSGSVDEIVEKRYVGHAVAGVGIEGYITTLK